MLPILRQYGTILLPKVPAQLLGRLETGECVHWHFMGDVGARVRVIFTDTVDGVDALDRDEVAINYGVEPHILAHSWEQQGHSNPRPITRVRYFAPTAPAGDLVTSAPPLAPVPATPAAAAPTTVQKPASPTTEPPSAEQAAAAAWVIVDQLFVYLKNDQPPPSNSILADTRPRVPDLVRDRVDHLKTLADLARGK